MVYTIKEYTGYNEKEILELYNSVGWSNYVDNPEMLRNAFAGSLKIFGAFAEERLTGIIRIVGDGYSCIFIQDLLIRPEFQRLGIGSALLQRILDEYKNVYQKHLCTDNTEKTVSFYKSKGFIMDTETGCRAFTKYY